MFHCHNLIHEDRDMLRAFVETPDALPNTSEDPAFVTLNLAITSDKVTPVFYSRWGYNNPLFGDTNATLTEGRPPLDNDYIKRRVSASKGCSEQHTSTPSTQLIQQVWGVPGATHVHHQKGSWCTLCPACCMLLSRTMHSIAHTVKPQTDALAAAA
jgi:hypothetical protein